MQMLCKVLGTGAEGLLSRTFTVLVLFRDAVEATVVFSAHFWRSTTRPLHPTFLVLSLDVHLCRHKESEWMRILHLP